MSQMALVSHEHCIERQTRFGEFSDSAGAVSVPGCRWRCGKRRNLANMLHMVMDADFVRCDASALRRDVVAPTLVGEAD